MSPYLANPDPMPSFSFPNTLTFSSFSQDYLAKSHRYDHIHGMVETPISNPTLQLNVLKSLAHSLLSKILHVPIPLRSPNLSAASTTFRYIHWSNPGEQCPLLHIQRPPPSMVHQLRPNSVDQSRAKQVVGVRSVG